MSFSLRLPHGHVAIFDDCDRALVSGLTLYRGSTGYIYFSKWENGKSVPRTVHSLLVVARKGMHVDHINGDKLDNRRSNLREATCQANQLNRKRLNCNNTSGIRGVSFSLRRGPKRPWRAQLTYYGKNIYLGNFPTVEEATAARRAAELKIYGETCP